ncbi:MAG: DUF362 domain-containing protein, partial [Gammaproteobacteria bacterium]|nr:DUF362 domain-containing protein [Gammaproteobacteria bacterium]
MSTFLQACSQAKIDPTALLTPEATQRLSQPTDQPEPTATTKKELVESAEPESTPTDFPTEAISKSASQVAFIKTNDRAQGVRLAMEMFDLSHINGKNVFLKPNFNSPDPSPGSTHPDVLRAIVRTLQLIGAGNITVGDRSGMGNTRTTMDKLGIFTLA